VVIRSGTILDSGTVTWHKTLTLNGQKPAKHALQTKFEGNEHRAKNIFNLKKQCFNIDKVAKVSMDAIIIQIKYNCSNHYFNKVT